MSDNANAGQNLCKMKDVCSLLSFWTRKISLNWDFQNPIYSYDDDDDDDDDDDEDDDEE